MSSGRGVAWRVGVRRGQEVVNGHEVCTRRREGMPVTHVAMRPPAPHLVPSWPGLAWPLCVQVVVDTVSCGGRHKCVAAWRYDKV